MGGKKHIHTYKQHVVKMLDRRLGAREPLECAREVSDVLMCWGTVFTSSSAPYDPTKCKKQEEALYKCQLSMESGAIVRKMQRHKPTHARQAHKQCEAKRFAFPLVPPRSLPSSMR